MFYYFKITRKVPAHKYMYVSGTYTTYITLQIHHTLHQYDLDEIYLHTLETSRIFNRKIGAIYPHYCFQENNTAVQFYRQIINVYLSMKYINWIACFKSWASFLSKWHNYRVSFRGTPGLVTVTRV